MSATMPQPAPTPEEKRQAKIGEAEMFTLLKAKFGEVAGNGAAYAVVSSVRSAAGFDSRRTLDAVAMSLWPSRGLMLQGFEIKCSRADWLRELKKPEKAEEFCGMLDRFWLVVSDKSFVHDGELPPTWGLMAKHGRGLRAIVDAPPLHASELIEGTRTHVLPPKFDRSFLACLMREACRVGNATPEEITAAVQKATEQLEARRKREVEGLTMDLDSIRERIRQFEQASGVTFSDRWGYGKDPEKLGAAVKAALAQDEKVSAAEVQLGHMRNALIRHANAIGDILGHAQIGVLPDPQVE